MSLGGLVCLLWMTDASDEACAARANATIQTGRVVRTFL